MRYSDATEPTCVLGMVFVGQRGLVFQRFWDGDLTVLVLLSDIACPTVRGKKLLEILFHSSGASFRCAQRLLMVVSVVLSLGGRPTLVRSWSRPAILCDVAEEDAIRFERLGLLGPTGKPFSESSEERRTLSGVF